MLLVEFWNLTVYDGDSAPVHGLFIQTAQGLDAINGDVEGLAGTEYKEGRRKLEAIRRPGMRLTRKKSLQATGKGYKPTVRSKVEEALKSYKTLTYRKFL